MKRGSLKDRWKRQKEGRKWDGKDTEKKEIMKVREGRKRKQKNE